MEVKKKKIPFSILCSVQVNIQTRNPHYNMAKTRSKSAATATATSPKASPTAAKVTKNKVTKPSTASPSKTIKTKAVKKTTTKKATPKKEEEEEKEVHVETVTKDSSLIPEEITKKAISELKKYISRQSQQQQQETENDESKKSKLFDEDEDDEDNKQNESFYLTIDSKKFWSSKPQFKPKSFKLTKPLYDNNQTTTTTSNSNNDINVDNNICLIIRDELVKSIDELNELENNQSLSQITQIIPLNSIKTEYKSFEKKRELYHQFKIFLVDEAILNIMPNTLGKVFYSKGSSNDKIPIPIKVTSTTTGSQTNGKQLSIVTLTNQLNKVLNNTYYLPPIGNNITIKIGKLKFDNNDLIANINDVVKNLDLDTIKSIHVKTSTSPAIPLFYTKSLSQ